MVLSVDDLVASLSNNHIGQEAIDIAALHAQLAQAIDAQQSGASRTAAQIKPCNTPTSTTMPCSWNRIPPTAGDVEYMDERMVEELSIPCAQTPIQAQAGTSLQLSDNCAHQSSENYPTLSHHYSPTQAASTSSDHCPAFDPYWCPSPSSPSLFTSTDPFYIAQLQEMQLQIQARARSGGYDSQTHNSFARFGKPDEASPFLHVAQTQAQAQRREQAQIQADFRYQWEQMYHQYYPATAVGS